MRPPCRCIHPLPLPRPRSLYVSVITTIRSYGDYLWVDVVERVDAMASQVGGLVWQAASMPLSQACHSSGLGGAWPCCCLCC